MKPTRGLTIIAGTVAVVSLCSVAAMGFEPITATIRVSNGALYDYVVIGEHHNATDGFDNAYDTVSPGNLNADMGEPFISVIIAHPDWKPAARELRGDVRLPGKRQEWELAIRSSLPKGETLKVALDPKRGVPPKSVRLTLKGSRDVKEEELAGGARTLSAPGPGKTLYVTVVAEQP